MSIQPGTQLGAYKVIELLGQGGMGEVYRACETKLDRDVAIKLLPESMTSDRERVLRFEREAKLLASLNHSNIAAVYGFDSLDERRFLALEFVDGETLAQRLVRGPLPLEEALEIAKQIAEALEAAHERGIVHRDLKPANVMVRADGTVKVLDFGLAKAVGDDVSDSEIANSPTITADYTQPGVVLGTAAYMSPEQARGRPLDKRTDIWSFGVILYECLTGQTLFRGETATDSMGAIMHREPDWSSLPSTTPPTIQLLLRRCLSKNRKRRLHDIADARVEIEEAISDPTSSSLSLAHVALDDIEEHDVRRRGPVGVIVGFILGAAIVAGVAMVLRPAPAPRAVRRFEFAQDLEPRSPMLSPDGTRVAFLSKGDVYIRDLNALEHRLVWSGEEQRGAWSLFWSPDSAWVGFNANNKLLKVPASGGEPVQISDKMITGCVWSTTGKIIGVDFKDGVVQLSSQGGVPRTLVASTADELHLHGGGILPDDRGVLFVPHPLGDDARAIHVATPDGARHLIYENPSAVGRVQYSNTGHILYDQEDEPTGTWALPFSLERLEATGEPQLVLSRVTKASVSDTGDLVYSRRDPDSGAEVRLVWVDREGQITDQIGPMLNRATGLALSPDGRKAAVSARGLGTERSETDIDLWVVDLERGTADCVAREEHMENMPVWSRDGARIAYSHMQGPGKFDVCIRNVDGSGAAEVMIPDAMLFSPDDTWSSALVTSGSWLEEMRIERVPLDDPTTRTPFVSNSGWDFGGSIRPGGGIAAYFSGKPMDQKQHLFIRRYPEGEGRWKVSMDPVFDARWSRTGDRLFYTSQMEGSRRGDLMEVMVTVEADDVTIAEPTKLMSMGDLDLTAYDVGLDSERFLMLQNIEEQEPEEAPEDGIVIIENWYEQFRKP